MKLVLDTSWLAFAVGSEPEPVIDFETKQHKTDDQGQPIYAVQLIASYRDDRSGKQKSEIVSVERHQQLRRLVDPIEQATCGWDARLAVHARNLILVQVHRRQQP